MAQAHGFANDNGYRCLCGMVTWAACSGPCTDERPCEHCRIDMARDRAEARSEQLYASSYGLGL